MKKLLILLVLLPLTAMALPLQTIDLQKWSYTYMEIAPKIRVYCDCYTVTNADGTESFFVRKFKSLRQVGNERACVVGGITDFFKSINGVTRPLLQALWMGGGASWNSTDNGITWVRIMPGSSYPEEPDPWCREAGG